MKLMRKEKGPEFYTGEDYESLKTSVKMKVYKRLYKEAIDLLPKPGLCSTIVDLGCGTGLLTDALLKRGYKNYLGIDFSQKVLDIVKRRHPKMNFVLGDITKNIIHKVYCDHKVFMLMEVLEHIENDIDVLIGIPSYSLVIFSVPNYDAESHVRIFDQPKKVTYRYNKVLDFSKCKQRIVAGSKKCNKIFLFRCSKK